MSLKYEPHVQAMLSLLDNLERAAGAYKCETPGEERVMAEYKKGEEEFLDVLRFLSRSNVTGVPR